MRCAHCGPEYGRYLNLLRILGRNLLSRCVGVEKKELEAFMEGETALSGDVSEAVCERIGFLNWIVDCLHGTYDYRGIRRWFLRHRQTLGCSPAEFFRVDWRPEEKKARKILEIATEVQKRRIEKFFKSKKRTKKQNSRKRRAACR